MYDKDKEIKLKQELAHLENRCRIAYGEPNSIDIVNMFIMFTNEINKAKRDE